MATFDFNDFQREMFLQVFKNPMQKAPETDAAIEPIVVKKTEKKAVKIEVVKEELVKKARGRPKGPIKRKREDDEEFKPQQENKVQKKARKPPAAKKPTKDVYKKTYAKKTKENANKSQPKVQKTSFEIFQEESNDKENNTLRRSTRQMMRASIDVMIEIIEKPFETMSQPEFLHFFGLHVVKR